MIQAIRMALIIFILAGVLYPAVITGIGYTIFRHPASGSVLSDHSGRIIGSQLIGQEFTRPDYFHSRRSASRYDPRHSGGYNQAITNLIFIARHSPISSIADATTASGSGLDPHITVANAITQVGRIASTRKLSPSTVRHLITSHTEHSVFASDPYVNVLLLNIALDRLHGS